MIPGVMVDFLSRASVAIASTRDASLAPAIHMLTGWYVADDGGSLVCLVAEGFSCRLVESLEDNGHLAVAAEVIGPHECYQFKGKYDGTRPVTAAARDAHLACRRRFIQAVGKHTAQRFTTEAMERAFGDPVLAVSMQVNEIFVQTPGPGAGGRLFPPPESESDMGYLAPQVATPRED